MCFGISCASYAGDLFLSTEAGHQSGKLLNQELVDGLCAGVSLVSQSWREHHLSAAYNFM